MKVRFTPLALSDLEGIYDYISKDNPDAASRVVRKLIERAQHLADAPYSGRQVDEADARVLVVPVIATSSST
jgi:toxin ParE1/3/4